MDRRQCDIGRLKIILHYKKEKYGLAWVGMGWYGLVCFGMGWYGLVGVGRGW